MNCITKPVTILLILSIALPSLTLITYQPVKAQTTSIPSVPEFTLKVVDHSYDVPSKTTSSTDPYTGEVTTSTIPGYHVDNKTIEITIKNQQFTRSSDNRLYYNVSYKGHYENEWKYHRSGYYARDSITGPRFFFQSSSEYTVIEMGAPTKGEMDFRVQAQIGYYTEQLDYSAIPGSPYTYYVFHGKESSWSSPKTINILSGSTSIAQTTSTPTPTSIGTPSPTSIVSTNNPTSTPQIIGNQPENSVPTTIFLTVVLILVAIITVLLILALTKNRLFGKGDV
jgi:hypothetical protein